MELRVWVDGTQRVVCGVKLTTTCQEIVFALAHATQQAGRFTMIERWRNNERLLSPNEQPLVTLQRWGDHMNEVEFILRKTSTDLPTNQPINQSHQRPVQQAPIRSNQDSDSTQQSVITNGRRESPINPLIKTSNQQVFNEQSLDMYQHYNQYHLNRRPQTVLGPLTGSNSSIGLGTSYLQPHQNITRFPNSFRTSMSASTLPSATNNMAASPSNASSMIRPRHSDDQILNTSSSSMLRRHQNGYTVQSENQIQQRKITNQLQAEQVSKNHPFEELYSTINKKRNNQPPPAVPAKPRVIGSVSNLSHQQLQPINNAQMNFHHTNPSPLNMSSNNMRPRNPPGYLDYMEAMANRNSLTGPIFSNPAYAQQSQHSQSNIYQRSFEPQQIYNMQQNRPSPVNNTPVGMKFAAYPNGQLLNRSYEQVHEGAVGTSSIQNTYPIRPKLIEPSLVVNRGSAVNVKLHPSSQNLVSHSMPDNERSETTLLSTETNDSVAQMGHDMLKVIEEQKRVLINQKNELDRLDNDQEYWETKQNSEKVELINRIEKEIRQLEELWKENQTQIKKLENQDLDEELRGLKSEQVKMELEIEKQKEKLSRCEKDIDQCKCKIEQLEMELADRKSDSDNSLSSNEESNNLYTDFKTKASMHSEAERTNNFRSKDLGTHANGSSDLGGLNDKGAKSSEDDEDDSTGDTSDDSPVTDTKTRSPKDVASVDKRGLISGLRSLKLDKSRALNRQLETIRPAESMTSATSPPASKDKTLISNNVAEKRCPETNGQYPEKTASSNNYELLMTL